MITDHGGVNKAATDTATAEAKVFDSRDIAASASWTLVANGAGTYSYGCTLHPTMKALLTVVP
jgi:plastocyanin